MVSVSHLLAVMPLLLASSQALVLPKWTGSLLPRADKPTLLSNFDAFDASPDREPPFKNHTYSKWVAGKYPKFCYDTATSPKSDTDKTDTCALDKLEVFDVTYSDCTAFPWTLCRCTDAPLSIEDAFNRFGRVPPGARSTVIHAIFVNGTGGSAASANNRFVVTGKVQPAALMHETMHSVDAHGHMSAGQNWTDAQSKDTCVPDSYSNTSPQELFAQVGVWYDYTVNAKPVTSYEKTSQNVSCFSNTYNFVKKAACQYVDLKESKCFKRSPNDETVTGKTGAKLKARSGPIKFDFVDHFY